MNLEDRLRRYGAALDAAAEHAAVAARQAASGAPPAPANPGGEQEGRVEACGRRRPAPVRFTTVAAAALLTLSGVTAAIWFGSGRHPDIAVGSAPLHPTVPSADPARSVPTSPERSTVSTAPTVSPPVTPAVTDTAASSALTACDDYRVNDRYPIRLCDRGDPVRLIQQALRDRGADVDVDGYFGPGTVTAVRRFQGAGGLNVDGLVGPRTWAALVPHAVGFDLDGSGVVDPDEIGSPGSATGASVTATTSPP